MTVTASKSNFLVFWIFVLLSACSIPLGDLQADIVTWGAATTITGDSDVSTNGTLFGAGNLADSDSPMINGVTFAGITFPNGATTVTSGNFEFSVSTSVLSGAASGFGSGLNPFGGLSTEYQVLLDSGMFTFTAPFAPPEITLEIGGLTIGQPYEFQWWVNDSRDMGDLDRTTTATAGNSVTLEHNFGNAEGGIGQFAIGTFTADASTQQIFFQGAGTGPNIGSTQINAFQLRAVGVPEPAMTGVLAIFLVGGLLRQRRRN